MFPSGISLIPVEGEHLEMTSVRLGAEQGGIVSSGREGACSAGRGGGRIMSRLMKIVILGLLAGLAGVLADLTPVGMNLEESVGLQVLFWLRGVREAPKEVVIVSLDEAPADVITLGIGQPRWPRTLYAQLLDVLRRQGVGVVAFDMIFDRPRTEEEDDAFARAIAESGNVVLCEFLRKRNLNRAEAAGSPGGELVLEGLVPPIPRLASAAAGLAPFPLPKVPARVSQYWTFEAGLTARPSLPVVAFQIFALETYKEFVGIVAGAGELPADVTEIARNRNTHLFVQRAREAFLRNPRLTESSAEDLMRAAPYPSDEARIRLLRSLVKMYQSPDSPYLDFYGPSGTVTHIPYREILQIDVPSAGNGKRPALTGKAVFIGLSEKMSAEQKDCFPTVFSQSDGTDLSGVEIAATAFANLFEDRALRPVSGAMHAVILLCWGMVLGVLCIALPSTRAAAAVTGLGLGYLLFTLAEFRDGAVWYPVATLLFVQVPLTLVGSICWKYADAYRERHNVKKALAFYLPADLVEQLSSESSEHGLGGRERYAVCLCTDASQYTTLSETMDPGELRSFMNRYYEAIFQPVGRYEGTIANVLGDSVLAMWAADAPDPDRRTRACEAALGITEAVARFNRSSGGRRLATRIGLHCGYVAVGNIGAKGRFEYRPVGDCVNTSSRIEGFNKQLGTQVLASEETLEQVDGLLTREVGAFLLAGKSKAVILHELVCREEDAGQEYKDLCAAFGEALAAFRRGEWDNCLSRLRECLKIRETDGPSLFYMTRCRQLMERRHDAPWNGVVCLEDK